MEGCTVLELSCLSQGFEEQGKGAFVRSCIQVKHFVEQEKCEGGEFVVKIRMEQDVVHEGGTVVTEGE